MKLYSIRKKHSMHTIWRDIDAMKTRYIQWIALTVDR